jgi:TolB-like protein/tetratricopeptide (TPR) repeat protein
MVLIALLERPGQIVTREELQQRLWPDVEHLDFEHGLNVAVKKLRAALSDSAETPRYIETLARRGYRFIGNMAEVRSAPEAISGKPAEIQPSIVVLPFANTNSLADDEYFSDGLAEEIINALTQISGLKVIARTSAFAFKGKNDDIRKIAKALGVTTVLEGSVRRAGIRLRVTAQLIEAANGTHLWSQRYDRELTDIFAVQDEISAAIVGALRVKLTGNATASRPHEPNLPAYEAFLKARHRQSRHPLPEVVAGIDVYFKDAIALDPQWADPHSALASQYFHLGMFGLRPLSEMVPLARAEARKALEILPSEPNAHALLGAIAAVYDYDWREADEQFKLARISESVPPSVHVTYALYYLLPLGRFVEAVEQHATAIAQDPLNVGLRMAQLIPLVYSGMYERTIVEARKVLDFDDRNHVAYLMMASAYFQQGNLAETLEPAEEAFRLAPWHAGVAGFLAGLLVQKGERERAEKLVATMCGGMSILGMMAYYLNCSDVDAAIDCYERAIEQRQPLAAQLAAAAVAKPLRSSPRWPKLAKMMNLPERG